MWGGGGRVSDPYPDPHGSALILVAGSGSGSGSRRAKITHKNKIKKVQNFYVFKYWMFSFEG
jgi:hypothetical protein